MKALLFLTALVVFVSASAREKKLILHDNGKVQYEYEVEGFMLDGNFSCYYESGKLKVKGKFVRNRKTGLWRVWDENGLLRSERIYTDNLEFEIISESDASGTRIKNLPAHVNKEEGKMGNPLFMHRFLQDISKDQVENAELFATKGLVDELLGKVQTGELAAFVDTRLTKQVNIPSLACYTSIDVVSLMVYEDYTCYEDEGPVMANKLLSVCPVVMENGVRKELGWVFVPDLEKFDFSNGVLERIRDHQYSGKMVKTTINDPSFRLRDVTAAEHDKLRLMLVEFEAAAILYVIDQRVVGKVD